MALPKEILGFTPDYVGISAGLFCVVLPQLLVRLSEARRIRNMMENTKGGRPAPRKTRGDEQPFLFV
jgi:hypothetical protein